MEYQIPDVDLSRHFTPLQMFQYYDKYSKFLHEKGRRETWAETVTRSITYLRKLSMDKLPFETYQEMFNLMYTADVSPSMRLFAHAGAAIQRNNEMLYNCSYHVIDNIKAFSEFLWLSMCGCGIATSVEHKFVRELPVVSPLKTDVINYTIQDSAEDWKMATDMLIHQLWLYGNNVTFDYSKIRPAGAPLITKGGYSSGPEVLIDIHEFIKTLLAKAAGRKLTTLEVFDLFTKLPDAGISGGVRRAAALCLFDYDDVDMLNAKYDSFWAVDEHKHRANANISAVWPDNVSLSEVKDLTHELFSTGTGEPGIFKRDNAIRTAPIRRKFQYPGAVGTNACFHRDTMVLTRDGLRTIESLISTDVEIWNGDTWQRIDNFRMTSESEELFRVVLHDGSEIITTDYHKFILADGSRTELQNLRVGDKLKISEFVPEEIRGDNVDGAYFKGFWLGDGTSNDGKPVLMLYEPKYDCATRLRHSCKELDSKQYGANDIQDIGFSYPSNNRMIMQGLSCRRESMIPYLDRTAGIPSEIMLADRQSKLEFISGYLDADGYALDTKNGFGYQVSCIHRNILLDLQLLLKSLGVQSTLRLNKASGVKDFNDGYGEYETQNLYRLTISQYNSIKLSTMCEFTRLKSFRNRETKYIVTPRWNKVVSIEFYDVDDVFCCTVPGNHQFTLANGIDIGQCGEIVLCSTPSHDAGGGGQFCNLSTVICKPDDDLESLTHKTRIATLIGDIQSLATDFSLRPKWKENCERDRLLGVNHIGHATSKAIRNVRTQQHLLDTARATDLEFAELFGVPESASITAVKPSGNSSVLFNTGPGINPVHDEYSIRNVTVSKNTAMYRFLKDYGVCFNEYPGKPEHVMFAFPYAAPDGAITLDDVSALDQLNYWLQVKQHLTEHNPSCSIVYRDGEQEEIQRWLFQNQEDIGGLTFFPHFDNSYALTPIQHCTRKEYIELLSRTPQIDWSILAHYEEKDETNHVVECSSGRCDLPS